MINNKRVLALIPARGGSKGIKNKNIIDLCGKPLISYSIEACKDCKYIDRLIVSTDSEIIAEVSKKYGAEVPILRPAEYAQDKSKTIDAVLHMVRVLKEMNDMYDVLVLIQPTQPLRTGDDITKALEKYIIEEEDMVSISEVNDNPLLIRTIKGSNVCNLLNLSSTCRRQDMDKFYRVNGCIYINNINNLNEQTSFNDNKAYYIMDKMHSVDIDEIDDLWFAETIIKHK